jgi:predicted nucleic acid-binding protein/predicted GNAT family acetyltransferase
MEITIVKVSLETEYFKRIRELWRMNSSTLGFMPKGGFIDQAQQENILAAISQDKICVGYLMYRISKSNNKAHIIHLCTDNQFRKQGIARKLIEYLIDETKEKQLYSVDFHCRRDYNLDSMWSSFGFIAKLDKPGKSTDGHLLTLWQFEHDVPQLIKLLIEQQNNSKIKVVIDANVFFDFMIDDVSDPESRESKYLLSDWLQEEIEMYLTEEIRNEINRSDDLNKREQSLKYTQNFNFAICSGEEFKFTVTTLLDIEPKPITARDKSDRRQLARAIAFGAEVFVTRDEKLLDLESKLPDKFTIQILRPTDLILKLDNLLRSSEYQPVRLGGTTIEKRLISTGEQNKIIEQFNMSGKREKKQELKRKLQEYLANPVQYNCFVVESQSANLGSTHSNSFIAFFVYDWRDENQLTIPLLRIRSDMIGKTIARHLLLNCIVEASNQKRASTKIIDQYLDNTIVQSLKDDLFLQDNQGWTKPHLVFSGNILELKNEIQNQYAELILRNDVLSESIKLLENNSIVNSQNAIYIERLFYPCKIVDADIPSFIIPIQARWAEHLFDSDLANQSIFGARPDLAFNREAVYYRSIRNSSGLLAPGRVLWYVSQDTNYHGTGMLRACSRIDKIIIGKPRELFRQFCRLGIYDFENVLKVAKNNLETDIMAIKFSDTELFKKPLPLQYIKEILQKNTTFPSPHKISKQNFNMLYNIGTQSS